MTSLCNAPSQFLSLLCISLLAAGNITLFSLIL
uniref:Uncharacterized protein n=1 Tax=Arundo donax TaxID=35708 RepID=A0A0A9CLD1_ARUDO